MPQDHQGKDTILEIMGKNQESPDNYDRKMVLKMWTHQDGECQKSQAEMKKEREFHQTEHVS